MPVRSATASPDDTSGPPFGPRISTSAFRSSARIAPTSASTARRVTRSASAPAPSTTTWQHDTSASASGDRSHRRPPPPPPPPPPPRDPAATTASRREPPPPPPGCPAAAVRAARARRAELDCPRWLSAPTSRDLAHALERAGLTSAAARSAPPPPVAPPVPPPGRPASARHPPPRRADSTARAPSRRAPDPPGCVAAAICVARCRFCGAAAIELLLGRRCHDTGRPCGAPGCAATIARPRRAPRAPLPPLAVLDLVGCRVVHVLGEVVVVARR